MPEWMMITDAERADIEKRFTYHTPTGNQPEQYEAIRTRAFNMATVIVALTPQSNEQAIALTNLEQAVMWANAAIARNG